MADEMASIKNSKPKFILVKDQLPDDRFKDWLASCYRLDRTFKEGRIKVFVRL